MAAIKSLMESVLKVLAECDVANRNYWAKIFICIISQ